MALESNAALAAAAVIGADLNDTVTPANPTPPTNISYAGFTPPATTAIAAGTPGDPKLFAANSGGMAHEGTGYESYDTVIDANTVDLLVYNISPNIAHPSHPAYSGATVLGAGEAAIGGKGGEDAVYADEELEDEEEDAAEAAKEANADKPRRGRPPNKRK